MMTYKFDVTEHEASSLQPAQLKDEPEQDFLDRIAEAKDKNVFVVLIYRLTDGSVKQRRVASPYFDASDKEQRWAMLQMALKMAGELVLQYEQDHPVDEPVKEKSRILLP